MNVSFKNNISWQEIGNAIYIVEEKENLRYKLEGSSKEIWLNINGGNVNEIIDKLCAKYPNESRERLSTDIYSFINELICKDLVGEKDENNAR